MGSLEEFFDLASKFLGFLTLICAGIGYLARGWIKERVYELAEADKSKGEPLERRKDFTLEIKEAILEHEEREIERVSDLSFRQREEVSKEFLSWGSRLEGQIKALHDLLDEREKRYDERHYTLKGLLDDLGRRLP